MDEIRKQEQEQENLSYRKELQNRKRIVVKIGSSSLLHKTTQRLNYYQIDHLARELSDLKNQGKDVVLVSSGAAAAGREALGIDLDIYRQETRMNIKQACAAVGQARLIEIYQKFFSEYNQASAQVLMTKLTVADDESCRNLINTFEELLSLNVIPVVNENDSVATDEFLVGDNDNLSAMVSSVIHADLLILLSDVDGLYTDDPRSNRNARFIDYVPKMTDHLMEFGKSSTGSGAGTGGMSTKLHAGRIATASGCDMVIANADLGLKIIHDIMAGENIGTLFRADRDPDFHLSDYIF